MREMTKEESIALAEKLQKDYANLDALKDQISRNESQIRSRSTHAVKGHSYFRFFWPWPIVAIVLYYLIGFIHSVGFIYSRDSVQYTLITLRNLIPIIALVAGAIIAGVKKANDSNQVANAQYSAAQEITKLKAANEENKKKIAKRRVNMQWFKIPPKVYFESGPVQYLEHMEGFSKAFIVSDPMMVQLGYVDKVTYYLNKREESCHYKIFSDVEPDPDVETVMRGVAEMRSFQPDVIIALGGGSAMDAAKCMWLFYEHPETSFDGLRQKFMDIRKRVVKFPHLGQQCKMVAIPTTSGTGSEVTPSPSSPTRRKASVMRLPMVFPSS